MEDSIPITTERSFNLRGATITDFNELSKRIPDLFGCASVF
jgi:hypothetical protein